MREILFRGKRVDNGEWVEGFYHFSHWYLPPSMERIATSYYILPIGEGDAHKVNPETIGQFTGLYDIDSKKIFEGDIVDVGGDIYVCRWDEGNFEFGLVNKEESFGIAYAPFGIKVIGNIHDNPELLEEG